MKLYSMDRDGNRAAGGRPKAVRRARGSVMGWIAAAGLLLIAAACGYPSPAGPPGPAPTPVPLTAPELIEVRAGPGDGAPVVEESSYRNAYGILPQPSIKIVIKQPPLTVGRLVTIDGVPIAQVASDAMHGDDAKFTVNSLWRTADASGNGDQEMIIVAPSTADRRGAGFTVGISLGDATRHGPPLRIMVGQAQLQRACIPPSLEPVFGGTDQPPPPPVVLSSNYVAQENANLKLDDPARSTLRWAIQIEEEKTGLMMVITDTANLPADQALVRLENEGSKDKALWAIKGNTCNLSGSLTAKQGQRTGDLLIKSSDTTTLMLSRQVCSDFMCTFTYWENLRIWSEPAFWKAFGGKTIDFVWRHEG
jgi:hypothetical protein